MDAMLKTAHWAGLPELFDEVLRLLAVGTAGSVTLTALAHPDASADDLLRSNRALAAAESQVPRSPPRPRPTTGRAAPAPGLPVVRPARARRQPPDGRHVRGP
jgi:hypothetical protein